ncbi:MAG: 2-C-methyl-D-erythritol 2,4-cyclodiphosphate synthase [Planctomycetota bacterium]
MSYRIGIGYDIHRLVAGRALRLGGIEIPAERGLLGHSDADIVLHAVTDALLGAAGQPDIGELFPDTDPAWAGAASRIFLAEALRRVRGAGLAVVNADVIIHAQQPRLRPYKERIRAALAEQLGIPTQRVGVKARTNEELDAVGRGEALACWASVLLEEIEAA